VKRGHRALGPAVSLLGQRLDLRAVCRDEGELPGDVESVYEDESEDGADAKEGLDVDALDRSSARKRGPG